MKIWTHTLVRNEERYIWFAVMSVIEHVDKMLIWDTGSDDATVEIIDEIKRLYPRKVSFRQVEQKDINDFTRIRQEMLSEADCDWIIIVDGDEVWREDSIGELVETINTKGKSLDSIVSKYYNVVGDIYHYQEEAAGMYKIDDRRGHLNIRAMNRTVPGLRVAKPHGKQGFFDENHILIQEKDKGKRLHIQKKGFLHFTNMPRSSSRDKDDKVPKRAFKLKHELGHKFPLDFYYPEVFFKSRPKIVSSPWRKRTTNYLAKAGVQHPLKKLSRIARPIAKTGY